jgi:hypothetical protein
MQIMISGCTLWAYSHVSVIRLLKLSPSNRSGKESGGYPVHSLVQSKGAPCGLPPCIFSLVNV